MLAVTKRNEIALI